jgi:hypothetical protein
MASAFSKQSKASQAERAFVANSGGGTPFGVDLDAAADLGIH